MGAALACLLVLSACGRYFPTALQPTQAQAAGMEVQDDGSVIYRQGRLAIALKPMTDAELNRQFTGASKELVTPVNPYTFGDWARLGDEFTPPRFTVFRLTVENYQFPKVRVDPLRTRITTANDRQYGPVTFAQLYDYYRAYWLGRTGQGLSDFRARTDLLKRTMYSGAPVFSGSKEEGFLVFPRLHDDVKRMAVHVDGIALRFDYAGQAVESVDLEFAFHRDVLRGYTPEDAVAQR